MKRIASVDLLLSISLVALIVIGLSDATSPIELSAHGCAAIALTLAGEWMVTSGATTGAIMMQMAGGLLLVSAPTYFHREATSLVGMADLAVGTVAMAIGVAGVIEISYEHVIGRRPIAR